MFLYKPYKKILLKIICLLQATQSSTRLIFQFINEKIFQFIICNFKLMHTYINLEIIKHGIGLEYFQISVL